MDKDVKDFSVYPFNTTSGKLFQLDGKYVLANIEGTGILVNPKEGVCYELTDTDEKIHGNTENNNLEIKSGVIEATLSWNYGSDINMNLDM